MKSLKQWISYQLVPKDNGKTDKLPVHPVTGAVCNAHDRSAWGYYNDVVARGLPAAFVFSDDDPYFFVDIDECLEDSGQWSQAALYMCQVVFAGCEVEVSQSGRGLHIFGRIPEVVPHGCDSKILNTQFYTGKRFVATTGADVVGDPNHTIDAKAYRDFISQYFPAKVSTPPDVAGVTVMQSGPVAEWSGPDDDGELIALAMSSQSVKSLMGKGVSFKQLWDADEDALSKAYPGDGRAFDWSSADSALCMHLAFWTGKDGARIERLWGLSGLGDRDKFRDRPDYVSRTIQGTCDACRSVYQGGGSSSASLINADDLKKQATKILDSQNPCEAFDTNGLPDLLRRYADKLCEQTAAEPIMIVQSILCTISAAVGRKIYIPESEYFQRLYGNIWCGTISKSGSFKTTALNKGAAISYKMLADIQKQIESLKCSKTPSKEESKALQDRIDELERQKPILSTRATAEALTEELATGQAGQIISSEMGAWLKNMNSSHAGSVKELLTDFYDCPAFYSYRTRTNGTATVRHPFITINAVSTLEWIQANLEAEDVSSGFFPRFLWFFPPQKNVIPAALPQLKKSSGLMPIINEITAILNGIRAQETPIEYRLSPDARQLFENYHSSLYNALFAESDNAQTILEPFVKRWSPYLLKLAMLMQVIENPHSQIIMPEALIASKHILDYAIKSTTYLFKNQLGETEHQRKCRRVLEYIAKYKGKRTWSQLLTSHTLTGGTKDYEYVCTTLAESGKIDIDTRPDTKQKHLYRLAVKV